MQKSVLVWYCSLAFLGHGWHLQSSLEKASPSFHARNKDPSHTLLRLLLEVKPALAFNSLGRGVYRVNPSESRSIPGPGTQHVVARSLLFMSASSLNDDDVCVVQDMENLLEAAEVGFRVLDLNADGSISNEEFKKYLQQYKYNEDSIAKIFEEMDLNGNGEVSLDELRDSLEVYCRCGECERQPPFTNRVIKEADDTFKLADANGDGVISAEELRSHLLANGYTEYAADAVFQSLDSNNDGEVSSEELRDGFLKYALMREAVAQVVKSLVQQKRWGWTPSQREEYRRKKMEEGETAEKS